MKSEIERLDNSNKEQETEVDDLKAKLRKLEKENCDLKSQLDNVHSTLKNVMEKAITDVTESLVQRISLQQKTMENQTNSLISSLEDQISLLTNMFNTTSSSAAFKPTKDRNLTSSCDDRLEFKKKK